MGFDIPNNLRKSVVLPLGEDLFILIGKRDPFSEFCYQLSCRNLFVWPCVDNIKNVFR